MTMPSELFSAIDRQSYPQRQRTLAAHARQLAGRAELGALVAALCVGDSFARDTGLFLATVACDTAALGPFLTDADPLIQARAIKAWLAIGEATAAELNELLSDAAAQTRAMVYRQLRVRRLVALADAIIEAVVDRFGAVEAARLLPACGPATVARLLPELGAAMANWTTLAGRHPGEVLAEADRQLAALPESQLGAWWARFGGGVFAAAVNQPATVFDLLDRYAPAADLPYRPTGYARLARAYPERVVDLMTAPQRAARIGGFPVSRALARALTTADDERLVLLGRRLRTHAEEKLAALLAAMAPSRRGAVYDAVYSGVDRSRALVPGEMMEALPHERRAAEARRILALEEIRDRITDVVYFHSFLPWAEARERLTSALRSPLADERALAYEALVRCARRSADSATVTEAVAILTRLRNEQDPVRSRAISELAAVPGHLFRAAATNDLTTLAADALAARDVSWATRSAVQNLALSVFQAHPTDPALAQWALLTLEGVFGDDRMPYLGRLDQRLRRGQEVQAFAAVRDWIESGTRSGKFSLLFSFTRALGRRAYALTGLQDILRQAIRGGAPSSTVRQAISLWLDDPATRGERVEEVLRHDLSTIALSDVWSIVDGRRTDLLDLVLGRKAPAGPFLAKGVRWAPGYARHVRRWLPRQRKRYAELLATIAKDASAAINSRASAIRSAAAIPDLGFAAVHRWVDSPNVALAEAALGALPWTDRPADALPYLLAHTGDDRARVAVYAARRAARYLRPSHLGTVLTAHLAGAVKVTSRKELLRLAVDLGVPHAGELLLADWSRPDAHTEVRAAVVGAARTRRELTPAWDILTEAATSGEYAVALTLLMADPFSLAEIDRTHYAALVVSACRSADTRIADHAWSKAPAWVPWAADIDEALLATLTNVDDRTTWMQAAVALVLAVRNGSSSIMDRVLRALIASDEADPVSSLRWQIDFARELVTGRGWIVAEFFDVGYSRRRAWPNRPEAAALLTALADPDRGFDAIVVGEYERAFYGDQLLQMVPIFQQHGVQLWLPEVDGPVHLDDPTHLALMRLLGVHSKREVLRARFRVLAAMRAQASVQGRHLGGRPPYGYRLADAGPHPNRVHAQWGRRLHKLEPHPQTAPHVRWMFAQRLTGRSLAAIARDLNDNKVPCPSGADRDRNRHRRGDAWTIQSVAAILANPRFTGRQVWNRQRTDRNPPDPADPLLGHNEVQRWNLTQDWVISRLPVHEALVSEQDFIAVQAIRATRPTENGTTRSYLLTGLLRCGICRRRMDAHWVHGRPGYRCRHGHTSARTADAMRPKNLYVREDHALAKLAEVQADRGRGGSTPEDLANRLRSDQLVITTNGITSTIEPAQDQPVPDIKETHPQQMRMSFMG